MHRIVRHATSTGRSAIDAIRMSAYQAATWFDVKNPANICADNDPPGTALFVAARATNPEHLLGTVAIGATHSRDELADLIGAEVPAFVPPRFG